MANHLTVAALFPPPDYAHAAVVEPHERLVFTAGGVPLDAEGSLIGAGDYAAQTRQVLANLTAALQAAGSDLQHVVATTVYVVAGRQEDLPEVWDVVRASGLADGPHTSTLLGVSCLGYTGQLVEITAVAVVPKYRRLVPCQLDSLEALDQLGVRLDTYAKIEVPTVLLGGGSNRNPAHIRKRLDAIQRVMPHAQRVVMPKRDHGADLKAPKEVARVIETLADRVLH